MIFCAPLVSANIVYYEMWQRCILEAGCYCPLRNPPVTSHRLRWKVLLELILSWIKVMLNSIPLVIPPKWIYLNGDKFSSEMLVMPSAVSVYRVTSDKVFVVVPVTGIAMFGEWDRLLHGGLPVTRCMDSMRPCVLVHKVKIMYRSCDMLLCQ